MENQQIPGPNDDPFEWLGNGILMDQRNKQNLYSTSEEHHVSDLNKDADANKELDKLNEPDLDDDPSEMLGRQLFMEQSGFNQQQQQPTKNNITGSFHEPVSEPTKSNEILVEDVCSVDENQLDTSEDPDSDRSYVVEDLFPSAAVSASLRLSTGVPATIFEEDICSGVNKTDSHQPQQQQELTSINRQTEFMSKIELEQNRQLTGINAAADNQTNQTKTSLSEYNDQLIPNENDAKGQQQEAIVNDFSDNFLFSFNEPSNVFGAANLSTAAASGVQNNLLQPDPFQFPIHPFGPSEPTNQGLQPPQIQQQQQLNPTSALDFPGSLYEVPLGFFANQQTGTSVVNDSTMGNQSSTSQLASNTTLDERTVDIPSAAASQPPRSDSELRYSGSFFGEPMGLPPPTQGIMNYGRALSTPSAACTITTAASTNNEYDSDSDESRSLFRDDVPKGNNLKRSLVESYGLFNGDTNDSKPPAQQNHVVHDFSTNDSSVDCKDEIVSAKKNREAPSSSKNNPVKTSLVAPDEEVVIAPGLMGYTGFDEEEDDDASCNNSMMSGTRTSYKKLRRNVLTYAKPRNRSFLIISGIVFVLLILVSVLLSMVVNNRAETAPNFNDPSGVESSDGSTVQIITNNGTGSVDKNEINATVSKPIETDVSSNSAVPSSMSSTSYPTASYTSYPPSLSLVETENASDFPIITETPSIEPTHGEPTLHPTSISSSAPPSNYHDQTETIAPSVVVTSISPTDISSSPSISASANPTQPYCQGSIAASNISESLALFSADEPCADFYVDICMDASETLTE